MNAVAAVRYDGRAYFQERLRNIRGHTISPHAIERAQARVRSFALLDKYKVIKEILEALNTATVVAFDGPLKPVCRVLFHEFYSESPLTEFFIVMDLKQDNVGIICTVLTKEMHDHYLETRQHIPVEFYNQVFYAPR